MRRMLNARGPSHLLLHAALQQHGDAGLDGERDLPAADVQMVLQGLPEGRLLHPGFCTTTQGLLASHCTTTQGGASITLHRNTGGC